MTLSVDAALAWAGDSLAQHSSPRLEAEVLLAHALACDRGRLYARGQNILSAAEEATFAALVRARVRGAASAQLVGSREFRSLPIKLSAATLIPRPETEHLVARSLELIEKTPTKGGHQAKATEKTAAAGAILDLATGSGCVAIAISREQPQRRLVATDIHAAALRTARRNAEALGVTQIEFLLGDGFRPVAGRRFAGLVCNPPYIRERDPCLFGLDSPPDARIALMGGGPRGLDLILSWISQAPAHLRPHGWLALEHGADQHRQVAAAMEAAGFDSITCTADDGGHARVASGILAA